MEANLGGLVASRVDLEVTPEESEGSEEVGCGAHLKKGVTEVINETITEPICKDIGLEGSKGVEVVTKVSLMGRLVGLDWRRFGN